MNIQKKSGTSIKMMSLQLAMIIILGFNDGAVKIAATDLNSQDEQVVESLEEPIEIIQTPETAEPIQTPQENPEEIEEPTEEPPQEIEEPTETPQETEEPTETPQETPEETEEPTETPQETPEEIEEPTETPQEIEEPIQKPEEIIETPDPTEEPIEIIETPETAKPIETQEIENSVVYVPKVLILDNNGECEYKIRVSGTLLDGESIEVKPDETFEMNKIDSDQKYEASVVQDITTFIKEMFNSEGIVETTGHIKANLGKPGSYSGTFKFHISMNKNE